MTQRELCLGLLHIILSCQDISPSAKNISMHSYTAFHVACRDDILFISASKTCIHFSPAAQQLGDVGVFLYLFATKRIALISNIFNTFTQYQHEA